MSKAFQESEFGDLSSFICWSGVSDILALIEPFDNYTDSEISSFICKYSDVESLSEFIFWEGECIEEAIVDILLYDGVAELHVLEFRISGAD